MSAMRAATDLDPATRDALAELLLTLADDEFVIGYWDSEWTGIAPVLEEDVAMSSLAQDEIGHAKVYYELLASLTGDEPDRIAYGRQPEEYRHARLLDHPRTDWAFSVARRYLYDTADDVRLAEVAKCGYAPLAEVVAKIRREETYHLLHADAWLRRLALARGEPRDRLERALETLWSDALTVFTPLAGEELLVSKGILSTPISDLASRWAARIGPGYTGLGLPFPFRPVAPEIYVPTISVKTEGGRSYHTEHFPWPWTEFTAVARLEPGATW